MKEIEEMLSLYESAESAIEAPSERCGLTERLQEEMKVTHILLLSHRCCGSLPSADSELGTHIDSVMTEMTQIEGTQSLVPTSNHFLLHVGYKKSNVQKKILAKFFSNM